MLRRYDINIISRFFFSFDKHDRSSWSMFCCDVDDKFNHKQQQLYHERIHVECLSLSLSLVVTARKRSCEKVFLHVFVCSPGRGGSAIPPSEPYPSPSGAGVFAVSVADLPKCTLHYK